MKDFFEYRESLKEYTGPDGELGIEKYHEVWEDYWDDVPGDFDDDLENSDATTTAFEEILKRSKKIGKTKRGFEVLVGKSSDGYGLENWLEGNYVHFFLKTNKNGLHNKRNYKPKKGQFIVALDYQLKKSDFPAVDEEIKGI